MNPPAGQPAAANAARELARLQQQVKSARAVLIRLQQQAAELDSSLGSNLVTQLVEVNEQLLSSALSAQTDVESCAQELEEVTQAGRMDALTGLPNRLLLLDRFAHAIAHAKRHGTRLALLFLDLDNFKQINDTLGHSVGDEVLKLTARFLLSSVRAVDTVSRHGGDEFLILLDEVAQASDAILVAEKVIAAFGVPQSVNGIAVSLTVSIGISIYPEDGEDADTLIKRADAAMYDAKRQGGGRRVVRGPGRGGERHPSQDFGVWRCP